MAKELNTSKINRDDFNPSIVLESLASGNLSIRETSRLLEEACHAIHRDRSILIKTKDVTTSLHKLLNCK